ncbi:FAD-dependent oxidoreductase [Kitasatospora kifunensis]|uniref:NADPH-dependent 2,4-dienoyl-CoA reductase/sulfur reductase-like enzyme/ferredoxin n=1 Tax=Kitasatospora kifunensis TaxID=58351 RepID=A0A7W7W0M5_KITKI|nr:FAD-dependent oxidoreductase [Kitasatospora kifunensis]MBB4928800.1 NADPH-dependent 2,4-dienoyl-CoA reductase/sulfur reductase-like enzyme/ferredoxin [Kitasatospora kifunensis]
MTTIPGAWSNQVWWPQNEQPQERWTLPEFSAPALQLSYQSYQSYAYLPVPLHEQHASLGHSYPLAHVADGYPAPAPYVEPPYQLLPQAAEPPIAAEVTDAVEVEAEVEVEVEELPLPADRLVPEARPVKVSVDNNRCHIYGICQQEAPEVFRISEGGSLHYTGTVPAHLAARARQAARCCPMQAVAISGATPPGARRRRRAAAVRPTGYRRIVVAGGGLAGLSAASRLRERGYDGELVLVGEELRRPYSRPPLSKQFLAGELGAEDLTFRADDTLQAHWLLGTQLLGLDTERKSVELRGGERLPYDGLVIATGVDAKRLPSTPVISDRIRTVRTLADAAAIQQAMQQARAHHLVILGGGFVGCELACTARDLGMEVTLIVHSAPLLRRVLGSKLGEVVGRIQARAGVDVRLSTRISHWHDTGAGLRLRLDDGELLEADFVVLGLGSVPRTEWLRGSTLEVTDGVLCDATCHALDVAGRPMPGIVAAGDVASWPNARFDATPRRVEHLIHAVEMGQHAADALLEGPDQAPRFTPVPRFWSEQHGTRLQAVGMPALGERMEIVEGSLRSESFVATYHRDTARGSQLVAAVAFDMPSQLLDYRDAIGRIGPLPRTLTSRRRRR